MELRYSASAGRQSSLRVWVYVGNHGVHIPVYNQGSTPSTTGVYRATFRRSAGMSLHQLGDFGDVQQYSSSAVSNYNGLTASFSQRLTYGFTVQASYTWSHAMDEVSNVGQYAVQHHTPSVYQINPVCLRCNNYGNADYDIRNYFSASFVWQTPFKFSNKYMNGALGGWTISQNFFARSGLPTTVIDGNSFHRQLHSSA